MEQICEVLAPGATSLHYIRNIRTVSIVPRYALYFDFLKSTEMMFWRGKDDKETEKTRMKMEKISVKMEKNMKRIS